MLAPGPAAREAACQSRLPELLPERAQRRGNLAFARERVRNAHVLEHQLQLERVVELAAEDSAFDVRLADPGHRRRSIHHLQHRLRVQAERLAHHQALGGGTQGDRGHQVVDALHRVPGALWPEVEDRLAHAAEQRARAREIFGAASDHEDEVRRLGAPLRTGDRCVKHGHALLGEPARRLPRQPRLGRRGVEQQRAALEARGQPDLAEHDTLHDFAVGQHRDHHVAAARHLQGRLHCGGTFTEAFRQSTRGNHVQVMQRHPVPTLVQVGAHRSAHDTQPDETDRKAVVLLLHCHSRFTNPRVQPSCP